MKNKILLLNILMLFSVTFLKAQEIVIHDFNSFEAYLNKDNDTTYVINFWATWCIPCVKELPYFQQVNEEFKDRKFKMILVSLDFKSQIDKQVIPFIQKNSIEPEVILLSDPNSNVWINKVNEKWSGSIPATIIYNKDFYYFHEGSMTYDELNELITKNIGK